MRGPRKHSAKIGYRNPLKEKRDSTTTKELPQNPNPIAAGKVGIDG
jgi:hypothetical protein